MTLWCLARLQLEDGSWKRAQRAPHRPHLQVTSHLDSRYTKRLTTKTYAVLAQVTRSRAASLSGKGEETAEEVGWARPGHALVRSCGRSCPWVLWLLLLGSPGLGVLSCLLRRRPPGRRRRQGPSSAGSQRCLQRCTDGPASAQTLRRLHVGARGFSPNRRFSRSPLSPSSRPGPGSPAAAAAFGRRKDPPPFRARERAPRGEGELPSSKPSSELFALWQHSTLPAVTAVCCVFISSASEAALARALEGSRRHSGTAARHSRTAFSSGASFRAVFHLEAAEAMGLAAAGWTELSSCEVPAPASMGPVASVPSPGETSSPSESPEGRAGFRKDGRERERLKPLPEA